MINVGYNLINSFTNTNNQGRRQEYFQEGGQRKKDRKIALLSLYLIYQFACCVLGQGT